MEMEGTTSYLHQRPAVLLVGSSSVGKRTLIHRLVASPSSSSSSGSPDSYSDEKDSNSASPDLQPHGWNIDNKYYTADVSLWTEHLHKDEPPFSVDSLPFAHLVAALVLVFDVTEPASFAVLQNWVSQTDIHRFDVLLCVANKVDLLPGHPAHSHYRNRLRSPLLAHADASENESGISESQTASLLGDDDEQEDPSWNVRRSYLQWCIDHNIELIEACASSLDFDACLSVDGDSQGVERVRCALSAHMWPSMVLKSSDKIVQPTLPKKLDSSEEEDSDYEVEYEVLSAGSAEEWDGTFSGWISVDGSSIAPQTGGSGNEDKFSSEPEPKNKEEVDVQDSAEEKAQPGGEGIPSNMEPPDKISESDDVSPFDFEDLEQLMSEIGNVRNSLRFMPDFQRKEMAGTLAIKMAAMFGGGSDDEEDSFAETPGNFVSLLAFASVSCICFSFAHFSQIEEITAI